ncbi:HNH endonuclease [Parasporobacterium paucivorans]|uniref:5-methylcytosine-specific restriction enzyme A n=1 Tax=Parasporobacterium paucivorans DSM 15970 TaxID=1122934 RepID=A0A1M6J786_9FIRM|nr:HNH endonuclease [Parasporobacterium paucivorans]SHJ42548.1 5-methylcytosine-specific restriction enzyme A [Parasporobacterium paucivorans DSM 15970]
MNTEFVLREYYIRYLRDVRQLSESSIKHYIDALNNISRYLVKNKKIEKMIYEVGDIGELEIIRAYLHSDEEFKALDKRGHRMYSASLNNYYKFAIGEGFQNERKKLEILDIEIPVQGQVASAQKIWKRSGIILRQSIESAGYKCEIDSSHTTFTAESTRRQYMEGHHAIPIHRQVHFDISLDVYANIVCLCPTCHRLLHHGLGKDKMNALNQIYNERVDRLAHSGIKISKSEFVEIAI